MPTKYFTIASLVLITMVTLSCGKPGVKHTSIDGEVKLIKSWELQFVDMDIISSKFGLNQFDMVDSLEMEARSDHTRGFAEQIKSILISRGHKFAHGRKTRGAISIGIKWRKIKKYEKAPERFEDRLYNEEEFRRQDKRHRDSLDIDVSYLGWKLFGKMYEISKVEVDILDKSGRSLGRIYIGGKSSDKVKPDYVADVIDKILNEGKY
jgi:hypothetical protein